MAQEAVAEVVGAVVLEALMPRATSIMWQLLPLEIPVSSQP